MADSAVIKALRRNWHAYLFLAPKLIVFVGLMLLPFFSTFVMTFQTGGILQKLRFIGIQNYINILRDQLFWISIKNTFIYSVTSIAGSLLLALLIASQLVRIPKAYSLFRALVIFPSLGSLIVVSATWRMMLFPTTGVIPVAFSLLGFKPVNWFGDQRIVLFTLVMVDVWWGVGFYSMFFLAALKAIPEELYDSAKIEGVKGFRMFFQISLPLIKPTLLFVLAMATIWNLQTFDLVYVMTRGGPGYATTTIVYYIYQKAFKIDDMGRAATMSFFMLIIMFAIVFIQIKVFKSEFEY